MENTVSQQCRFISFKRDMDFFWRKENYRIIIDGKSHAYLRSNETVSIYVDGGSHCVQLVGNTCSEQYYVEDGDKDVLFHMSKVFGRIFLERLE